MTRSLLASGLHDAVELATTSDQVVTGSLGSRLYAFALAVARTSDEVVA